MQYKVADIIRDIRVVLDENMVSSPLSGISDSGTLCLDEIIRSKIADAARIVEISAPSHLLDRGEAFSTSIHWSSQVGFGSGSTHLPDDFMRLISFQMSDWSHAVTVAISETDPEYALQSSRYPGVRGCPQRPVVAIIHQPIGLVLEFYSCMSGDRAHVKRARYLPLPRIIDDEIRLCEKLYRSIIYYAGYLVSSCLGDTSAASSMLNTSQSLMS